MGGGGGGQAPKMYRQKKIQKTNKHEHVTYLKNIYAMNFQAVISQI